MAAAQPALVKRRNSTPSNCRREEPAPAPSKKSPENWQEVLAQREEPVCLTQKSAPPKDVPLPVKARRCSLEEIEERMAVRREADICLNCQRWVKRCDCSGSQIESANRATLQLRAASKIQEAVRTHADRKKEEGFEQYRKRGNRERFGAAGEMSESGSAPSSPDKTQRGDVGNTSPPSRGYMRRGSSEGLFHENNGTKSGDAGNSPPSRWRRRSSDEMFHQSNDTQSEEPHKHVLKSADPPSKAAISRRISSANPSNLFGNRARRKSSDRVPLNASPVSPSKPAVHTSGVPSTPSESLHAAGWRTDLACGRPC